MSQLFNKSFRFDVEITKANKTDNKFFVEGYASTSDLDRQGDIICKQALEKAAEALLNVNNTVFYGHEYDLNNAVGKIVEAKADDIGLKVKIYVSEWAEELRTKLNEGIINKFSIGGRVSKDRQITREEAIEQALVDSDVGFDNINIIEGIDLFEVSFVGVPANPNAQVVGLAKALKGIQKKNVEDNSDEELDKRSEEGGVKVDKKENEVVKEEVEETQEAKDISEENIAEEKKEESVGEDKSEESKEEVKEESDDEPDEVKDAEEEEVKEEDTEEKKEEESDEQKSEDEIVDETKAIDEAIMAIAEELNVSEEKVREALAPLMADESEQSEEEMSEEEIKELIDGKEEKANDSEESKEEVKSEDSDLEKKVSELEETIKTLAGYIKDKVKIIEVNSDKKSLVKKENPEVVKEKKEKDGDEEFLDFLKGNK